MDRAPHTAMLLVTLLGASRVFAWGRGHALIRPWAVSRLPQWQKELVGEPALTMLCSEFMSLQDQHASGRRPDLDRYCVPPGARVSLHDVGPAHAAAPAMAWYLDQVRAHLRRGERTEAMKSLGVLCHWHEDPGSPSAHSSPVTETVLRQLIPPPDDKQNRNYLYGYGGIADRGRYTIPNEPYKPALLGASIAEAAARLYQAQRVLRYHNSQHIVPVIRDEMYGDGSGADEARAAGALYNAKHVADVIYTALCLAADRVDPGEAGTLRTQRLTEWLSDYAGGPLIPHPHYVVPFLVDQSMDAERRLHPLRFWGEGRAAEVAFGFGMGAPFALDYTFAPSGAFAEFTCRVGLHVVAGKQGHVKFRVHVNGRLAQETDFMGSREPAVLLRAALPASPVVRLRLETVPAPGSPSLHNLAVWAEPTLHREPTMPGRGLPAAE